jgi:RNA polymerase sigma-70 factor (ECF subfamily)
VAGPHLTTTGSAPQEPDSDADLLRRHLAGDPDAFGALVVRHRDRAWAVAVRTLGNAADAEDAVQDAFISVLRAAPSFRFESAVSTWLHRIVVNACLDRLRRSAVRPQAPLEEAADTVADPYAARDLAMEVARGLAGLPVEQRAAIVLVDLQGIPVVEAAALLGVAEGTVKSRCARGRARLAVLLGHLREGNPGTPQPVPSVTEESGQGGGAA